MHVWNLWDGLVSVAEAEQQVEAIAAWQRTLFNRPNLVAFVKDGTPITMRGCTYILRP